MSRRQRNFMGMMAPSGYQVQRSLRFRASASAYLSRTFGVPTNDKMYTLSWWGKLGDISTTGHGIFSNGTTTSCALFFHTDNTVRFRSAGTSYYTSTQVFRDSSAHGHWVMQYDSANGTQASRIIIYYNNVLLAGGTCTLPLNTTGFHANTSTARIGNINGWFGTAADYFDGCLSEWQLIDGQLVAPSAFAKTDLRTGQWLPIQYTGTYGANGFYLDFRDNSSTTNLCLDRSGNGNHWTPTNISVTAGVTYDSMLDVPTQWEDGGNGRGNYCTLNPLDKNVSVTVSDGNLSATAAGTNQGLRSTTGVSSGKWYFEGKLSTISGAAPMFGITDSAWANDYFSSSGNSAGYGADGSLYFTGGFTGGSGTPATYTTGDIIGVAFDLDNLLLTFYKNNVVQRSGVAIPVGVTFFAGMSMQLNTSIINFGQRPFTYTPPTGYKALNTFNLPEPTILQGNRYVDIDLYTGTGATRTKTGLLFQPDHAIFKGRSGATDWAVYDVVRGVQKDLAWNTTAAETTEATGLTAFTSAGYTIGALAKLNTNAATYMAVILKAGGTASSNTNGSITSQVSAGVAQGISILTYTGTGASATVGHGLGVAPKMIIVKCKNNANDWVVYHIGLTSASYRIFFNTSAAQGADNAWNATTPGSSVFTLGGGGLAVNETALNYVAYCFTDVTGFSRFGSYGGNGSADGPFVHLGFRPKWILLKRAGAAGNWNLFDSARNPYNLTNLLVRANLADAENTAGGTDIQMDFTANGFKPRGTSVDMNGAAATYIYAAFAENPFKYSNSR